MRFKDKASVPKKFERTHQGYLIVPAKIARIGGMTYLGEEIGKTKGKEYTVYVDADELFSPETIKSFEGMPITITHPDDLDVSAKDWKEKSVGHVQNVRRDGDFLVCDAYIQDEAAIKFIEDSGVRETSIGYDSELKEVDGRLTKSDIVGNHVAIEPMGRAGNTKIGDRKPKMNLKQLWAAVAANSKKQKARLNDAKAKKAKVADAVADLNKRKADAEAVVVSEDATDEEKLAAIAELQAVATEALEQATELTEEVEGSGEEEVIADADPDESADAERLAALEAENEQLKTENEALKAELDEIKNKEGTASVIADAKALKSGAKLDPKMKVGDAKRAVLADSGVFTAEAAGKLDAVALNAAYAAYKATAGARKTNNVGRKLLGDGKPNTKTAAQRMGGK